MPDLNLQSMLRGDFVKKPPSSAKALLDKFDLAIDYFTTKYVDNLQLEKLPEGKLESLELKRQKLIQEVKEIAKCSELSPLIHLGCKVIFTDGEFLLQQEKFAILKGELVQAKNAIEALDLLEPLPDQVNDILKISSDSLDMIFQIAVTNFTNSEYQKCLALFALLVTMNPNHPEYWFRLGISAQKCDSIDLALRAYRNTIALNPTIIGARLFAAECSIASGAMDDARTLCSQAKELMANNQVDEIWPQFLLSLESQLEKTVS